MEYSQKTPKTPKTPSYPPWGKIDYALSLRFSRKKSVESPLCQPHHWLAELLFNIVVLLFSGFVECINNAINKTTRQPTTIFRADTSFGKYQPLFMQFFNGC